MGRSQRGCAQRLGVRWLDAASCSEFILASDIKAKLTAWHDLAGEACRRMGHRREGGGEPPHSKVPSAQARRVVTWPEKWWHVPELAGFLHA